MDINISHNIMGFFNNVADMTSDYVDRIELAPILLYGDLYLTGLKRNFTYGSAIELHIKEIKKIKINGGGKDEYWFKEPENEMWIPCHLITEAYVKRVFDQFVKNFGEVKEFHVVDIQYKEKGKDRHHSETIYYQDKKTAYKDVIKFRKEYEQCSSKFHIFSNTCVNKDEKPSDFEILTAAAE